MRIIVWNCNGGFGSPEKINFFHEMKADLAIIPEMRMSNVELLKPNQFIWITNNRSSRAPKGLGVLTFNSFEIKPLDRDDEMEIYIPAKIVKGRFSINLLAVWNFYSRCKQGRFKGARGLNAVENAALALYRPLFNQLALAAGDWNIGPTLKGDGYTRISEQFASASMKCLYHTFHGLSSQAIGPITYRHTSGARHWIDHMFGSIQICENIQNFQMGNLDRVIGSDHVPIILDLDDQLVTRQNIAG